MGATLWMLAGAGLISVLLLTGCGPFTPYTPTDTPHIPPQEPNGNGVSDGDSTSDQNYGLEELFGDGEGIEPPAME